MDGFEVARNLRRELPGVTILALSGYGGDDHRARAAVAGFDGYMVKPIDLDTLLRGLAAARAPNGLAPVG